MWKIKEKVDNNTLTLLVNLRVLIEMTNYKFID